MESIDQMPEDKTIRISRILENNNNMIDLDVVPTDKNIKSYMVTIKSKHIEEVIEKIKSLEYNNDVYY
jgi:hypothetical protein